MRSLTNCSQLATDMSVSRFLFFFYALLLYPDFSCQHDYLDDYFDKVVEKFYKKIVDMGASSLPVNDVNTTVNRVLRPDDLRIQGQIWYTGGVLIGFEEIFLINDGHRGVPGDNSAQLFWQVDFPNLTIVFDVAADIYNFGTEQGNAELFYLNSTIGCNITIDYATGKKSVDLRGTSASGPYSNFQPSTTLMDALGRVARLEMGRKLFDQMDAWSSGIFHTLMQESVDEVEFPIVPPDFTEERFSDNSIWKTPDTPEPLLEYVRLIARGIRNENNGTDLGLYLSDVEYQVSETLLGVDLHGTVDIYSGLVTKFDDLIRANYVPETNRTGDIATIKSGVTIKNLTLTYDLVCDLSSGSLMGSIMINLDVTLNYFLQHSFSSGTTSVSPREVFIVSSVQTFEPVDDISLQAVRILLSRMNGDNPWYMDDLESWDSEQLVPMVVKQIENLEFPISEH